METAPSDAQLVGSILVSLFAAIVFGLGVSFLVLGYPAVRRRIGSTPHAVATYVPIAWILVSCFPHDNLHMFVGEDPGGILAMLVGFHATLMIGGLVLAYESRSSLGLVPRRRRLTSARRPSAETLFRIRSNRGRAELSQVCAAECSPGSRGPGRSQGMGT